MNSFITLALCLVLAQVFTVNGLFGSKKKEDENAPLYHVGIVMAGGITPFCAGVVVADNWVATSSYCVQSATTLTMVEGVAGAKTLNKAKKSNIVHFNGIESNGGIALLRTQESLFATGAHVVSLPSSSPSSKGVISDFVGKKDTLAEIQVNLTDNERCRGINASNQFCLVSANPDKENFCEGAQGAPFVVESVLQGIREKFCSASGTPGIFADVFKYLDWMKEVITSS